MTLKPQEDHKSEHRVPPAKPGEGGKGTVFICTVCGRKFVRTMTGQVECCTSCMVKAKNIQLQQEEN